MDRVKAVVRAERLAAALNQLSALHVIAARQSAIDMFEDDVHDAFREVADALGYSVAPIAVETPISLESAA